MADCESNDHEIWNYIQSIPENNGAFVEVIFSLGSELLYLKPAEIKSSNQAQNPKNIANLKFIPEFFIFIEIARIGQENKEIENIGNERPVKKSLKVETPYEVHTNSYYFTLKKSIIVTMSQILNKVLSRLPLEYPV